METWKDIPGYEGYYQASNLGRIKSLKYRKTKEEKVLKLGKIYKYSHVQLRGKTFRVHRLIALAFIPNTENKPYVCHKDETLIDGKLNNSVDNLWWGTSKENSQDRANKGRNNNLYGINHPAKGKYGKDNPMSKPVLQYSINMDFIKEWGGIKDIERGLGIHHPNISKVCKQKRQTAGGYIWKYKTPE